MLKEKLVTVMKKAARITKDGNYPGANKFFIEIKGKTFTIRSRNQVMDIHAFMELDSIEKAISCIIPAKLFLNIINKIPDLELSFSISKKNLVIQGEKSHVKLPICDEKQWPMPESFHSNYQIELDESVLSCSHALAEPSMGNSLMASYHIESDFTNYRITALDGRRISIFNSGVIEPKIDLVVENEIIKEAIALSNGKTILETDGNHILFRGENLYIYGRTRAEKYFSLDSILANKSQKTIATVNAKEFKESIILATLFDSTVILNFTENQIELFSKSNPNGGSCCNIAAEISGDPLRIGVCGKFLIDSIDALKTEKITLNLGSEKSPIYAENDTQLEFILPICIQ